ncbi:DUF5060 domain-containing protein [Brumimicrobium mesophilum]|uniref:DUF5060 domain-containing protein n=1 Tax=Brumimicrobium mesophilum TaxID=392717 RepID=UPI000D140D9E|nr:DUF5060 domain-containing protein [Brumimicrobium mesophilum]
MRCVLVLFLIFPIFTFSQLTFPENLDFEFINQDQSQVSLNSRLELGLNLPPEILDSIQVYMEGEPNNRGGLNPFMSWDINVEAHFKHEKSQFTAIGFWYTDMRRNHDLNIWEQLETNKQFRVRFAPTELGNWQVYMTVEVNGKSAFKTVVHSFNVVSSDNKGFVSLNDSTQYLERDGETIIPTGINLPFPSNKNNLMYSTDENLDLAAWDEYQHQVQDYILQGGEYFRMFMHPSVLDVEFEEVGYYQNRQNLSWEMDQLLSICEENNTLINFNLMYHSYFMKLGDYSQFRYDYADYWPDPKAWPYKDPFVPSGYSVMLDSKTPSDMFLHEEGMRFLKERIRYIMARWGYSTSIATIELLCEPWHMDENPYANEHPYDQASAAGDIARKAVYEYHKQMGSYIKDSIQYNNHLLTAVGRFPVGKTAIYSHFTNEEDGYVDSTWYLDDVDFITISYYSTSPAKLIHSKSSSNNIFGEEENSMAAIIERLRKTYNKPVLFGESDHGDETHMCSDYQGHKIDVMRYAYTGAIGHFIWAAFIDNGVDKSHINFRDESVSWPDIISAKDYFNSDWFSEIVNSKTALGREKINFNPIDKDVVEHQYIIGKDSDVAAGYVYNRTFNIFTVDVDEIENLSENGCGRIDENFKTPIEISWRPKRMKVEGLKAFTKYRLLFYDYTNHSLISEANLRTSIFGNLKLTHPILTPKKTGTPLLWYRIERYN